MPDGIQTARPRLARVGEEMRNLGVIGLGIALCTMVSWLTGWLADQDVRPLATGVAALVGMTLTLVGLGVTTRRRVTRPVRHETPPIGSAYETRADAAQRRGRLGLMMIGGPVLLLVLDRMTREGGEFTGFLAGAFAAQAVLALGEAGLWFRRERKEGSLLYVLIKPHAMMPALGTVDIYVRPRAEPDEVSPFEIPL